MHTRWCGRMPDTWHSDADQSSTPLRGVDNGEDLQTADSAGGGKIEALPYQADLLEGIVALRVTGCRKNGG